MTECQDDGQNASTMLCLSPGMSVPAQPVGRSRQQDDSQFSIAPADPFVIDAIVEQWRQRQSWHRAEKSLTLQAKAICRRVVGGDKKDADALYNAIMGKGEHVHEAAGLAATQPILSARDTVEAARKGTEKKLTKLALQLPPPVVEFCEQTRGLALPSLAAIVGEAGDLSNYSNPAKLWKRMGLAVMPDGGRERRVKGVDAIEHGYNAERRSVMWNIGEALLRAGGAYADLIRERKTIEVAKAEAEGLAVKPSAQIKAGEQARSNGHIHNRAKRYAEKRLLRDLWRVWRQSNHGV